MKKKKEDRTYHNLLRVAEEFIQGKNFASLSINAIMRKLNLPEELLPPFKRALDSLVQKGLCNFSNGLYQPKRQPHEVATGIIRINPRGFGFVNPDDASLFPQDIFIPKHLTQNAVDGDRVEVRVNLMVRSEKGPEGKVQAILERGRTHLAGIVTLVRPKDDPMVYVPVLGAEHTVLIRDADQKLQRGDRVILEVLEWGDEESPTTTRLSHLIGPITDASKDVEAAIEEFDLKKEFPASAIAEAEAFGSKVTQSDLKGREDFRPLECVTIDPTTAKDFDDAITISVDDQGCYNLGVHIADVSHYVKPGTALDDEALKRCNSTYFPGTCVPMLPHPLSENLCSLRANVIRLTASVMMRFDKDGNLLNYRIVKGVIKSRKRFTYREAKEVLDGKQKSPYSGLLNLMVELCNLLKKKRYERGSIEFCIPELRVVVDAQGVPTGTEFIPYDITHQMVEEFMLKANEVVATHLNSIGRDLTYRVHDQPSGESLKDFVSLAYAFGYKLPDEPTPMDLQTMFDEALQAPIGTFLATSYIRRMKQALYSPANIGHYGLALTHYCHFTSPIRRYIDLVIHRLLFDQDMEYDKLAVIADQCSERERISERAERNVTLLKKLRLLKSMHDQDRRKQYQAIVTRVRNFGITFEIADLMIEGFLHVSEIGDDYYEFNDSKAMLTGNHTGATFFSGDKITVMIRDVDLILLETRWFFVATPRAKKKKK